MKIFTKVPDFTGIRATVMFVNGQGDTDDPALIEWFRVNGYTVGGAIPEPIVEEVPENIGDIKLAELKKDVTVEFPHFPSMTSDEIRDWAKSVGLGAKIKNYRDKDKLIALLTSDPD